MGRDFQGLSLHRRTTPGAKCVKAILKHHWLTITMIHQNETPCLAIIGTTTDLSWTPRHRVKRGPLCRIRISELTQKGPHASQMDSAVAQGEHFRTKIASAHAANAVVALPSFIHSRSNMLSFVAIMACKINPRLTLTS